MANASPRDRWRSVYLPYLLLGVLHLPLVSIYWFRDLWSDLRAHYHFFPFLLAAVVFLIWDRWPRGVAEPLRVSRASSVLFVLSSLILVLAIIFLEPPLAGLSFALGVSSFLLRIKDSQTGGSLFPISLLLYVLVHSPFGAFNEDRRLITLLQQGSARITSTLLDLMGVMHDMPGTVLMTAERKWGVEEACSGVQSFFTLLFCSVFLAIWLRRPLFRGFLLVASSLFWAVVMNTVRIFAIPVAYLYMGIDLAEGWQHAALGYMTLLLGILMLLSTDQFLEFVFGSIDSEKSGTDVEVTGVGRFWNKYIAGRTDWVSLDWKPARSSSLLLYATVAVPSLVALVLSPGLVGLASSQGIDFFRRDVVVKVDSSWLPEQINGWKMVRYEQATRERGSDLGQRSDVWYYQKGGTVVTFSFDQAFPGWHELTTCYLNSEIGWRIADDGRARYRGVAPAPGPVESDDEVREVSLVEVDLEEPAMGRQGYLVFGLDDSEGVPLNAPGDWSIFTSVTERLKNRFAYEIRSSFFRSEGYQTQLFVSRQVSDSERQELKQLYLELRAQSQQQIRLAKQNNHFWTSAELLSMHHAEKAAEKARESLPDDRGEVLDPTPQESSPPGTTAGQEAIREAALP